MAVFGSLSGEGSKLSERCDTSFLPHRSSRVLRGNGVLEVKYFSGVPRCQMYRPLILNEKGSLGVINFRRMVKVANIRLDVESGNSL